MKSIGSRTCQCASAGVLEWDILALYRGVLEGLRAAGRDVGQLDSVGIDSWAVDYGLLDATGALLANPVHYRDERTAGVMERVLAEACRRRSSTRSPASSSCRINTLYQLVAALGTPAIAAAKTLLLVPDLVSFWLTGDIGAEITNASTTQLLDVNTEQWATGVMSELGIDPQLFPPLRHPGAPAGQLRSDVLAETGLVGPVAVTTVGSHDTASAVVGVPAVDANFGYISCGTWSLVGLELDRPVLTDAARSANFTNETGRRRHDPISAQRHGVVAAAGMRAHLEFTGATSRPRDIARRGWPGPAVHGRYRPR